MGFEIDWQADAGQYRVRWEGRRGEAWFREFGAAAAFVSRREREDREAAEGAPRGRRRCSKCGEARPVGEIWIDGVCVHCWRPELGDAAAFVLGEAAGG